MSRKTPRPKTFATFETLSEHQRPDSATVRASHDRHVISPLHASCRDAKLNARSYGGHVIRSVRASGGKERTHWVALNKKDAER